RMRASPGSSWCRSSASPCSPSAASDNCASGDQLTDSNDLGRKKMCQVAGAFAEYEKGPSRRQAAQRTQAQALGDRQEGWRPDAELWPAVVAEAKRLPRASPETGERLSLREIGDRLKDTGHLNERGQPFNAQSVRAMIEGPQPRPPPPVKR